MKLCHFVYKKQFRLKVAPNDFFHFSWDISPDLTTSLQHCPRPFGWLQGAASKQEGETKGKGKVRERKKKKAARDKGEERRKERDNSVRCWRIDFPAVKSTRITILVRDKLGTISLWPTVYGLWLCTCVNLHVQVICQIIWTNNQSELRLLYAENQKIARSRGWVMEKKHNTVPRFYIFTFLLS